MAEAAQTRRLPGSALRDRPVLAGTQLELAEAALLTMSPATRASIDEVLERARLPQERALILKAVAARAGAFGVTGDFGPVPPERTALGDVRRFAGQIRGMDLQTLVDQTSVVPVHRGDATAFVQKFHGSCGPTAAQVLRAELDPVEALAINRAYALSVAAVDNRWALEQETALEAARPNDTAGLRAPSALLERLEEELGARLPVVVRDFAAGRDYDPAAFAAALDDLEARTGRDALDQGLRLARESNLKLAFSRVALESEGTLRLRLIRHLEGDENEDGRGELERILASDAYRLPSREVLENTREIRTFPGLLALNDHRYTRALREGLNSSRLLGKAPEALLLEISALAPVKDFQPFLEARQDAINELIEFAAERLEDHEPVIFSVSWDGSSRAGHALSVLDMRTDEAGARSFLVYDVFWGNAGWVTEDEIRAGDFTGDDPSQPLGTETTLLVGVLR